MLRRLDVKTPWRSLDEGFWSNDHPLGCRTVVYGHNGSGKSTLAELLLSLAEGACATGVVWEDEQKSRTNISAGEPCPSAFMAVFTRKWVEANLSAFLDGASASAIVTLGKEAIEAKEEEGWLVEEITRLREDARKVAEQKTAADGKVEKMARDLQDRIVLELKAFDYDHFTKNRYSLPKVQDDLRKHRGAFPDRTTHAEALKCLGERAPSTVPEVTTLPPHAADALRNLAELLAETPTRIAIATLEGKPSAQAWVEQGLQLHEDSDRCLFCAGELIRERRDQLARHFDESWLHIRSKATSLLAVVTEERRELVAWHAALPASENLVSELQSIYHDAVEEAGSDVARRTAVLARIERTLSDKIADPSAIFDAPELSVLSSHPPSPVLAETAIEHNRQVRRHADATAERKQLVLDHLVGSQSEAFQDLEKQTEELAAEIKAATDAEFFAKRRLDEIRQAKFTNKDMADTLTRDLARVYGKNHLSVVLTPDGKSYACRRGDEPGRHLSEGERTTLSLLYFLRNLENQQASTGDRAQRIVVIDDPSSSLDRESLFATHQWLIDTLEGFGQYILLTHDFSLLRLFIKAHKNAWGKSLSRIKKNDADEARFPKVSFLELYAASINGERHSRVAKLPRVLLNTTSEYAYLFSMVMAGIAEPENHERLFLLPNAARRVLEVFASYKAPHRTDFLQQLDVLVESQENEGGVIRWVHQSGSRWSVRQLGRGDVEVAWCVARS